MNENEFRYDGRNFKAVEGHGCRKCWFEKINCFWIKHEKEIPHCHANLRKDKKMVIFVETEE